MNDEHAFAGLAGQTALLERGTVSSRELVELAIGRIESTQPTLNAFRVVRGEHALAEADAADGRRAAGESAPLLGVPVAIKDDVDLAGETTPFGCAGEFEPASEDCEAVRRLRSAGAVIVGKTTTPELGQWPITEGSAFGITRNPWNRDHTPGGSSGGSAAAVSAGLVPGALGSDGLGSVRIPAAWTHLVGIKPQRERISTWPDLDPFNGLAVIGPLTRTVADAARLLDVAAGSRPGDHTGPPAPSRPYATAAADGAERGPGRLRIAIALRPPFTVIRSRLHPEIRAAVERLGGVLGDLGHEVSEADVRYGIFGAGVLPRSLNGLGAWGPRLADHSLLDERTAHNIRLGGLLRGPVLAFGRALEAPMRRQIGVIFKRFDVVITPTSAQPPLAVGAIDGLSGWATDRVMTSACPYTWTWNVTGWPGVNVPAGLTAGGLPIGAQLLGPANSEPLLISLAAQLETAERWHERRPPVSVLVPTASAQGETA